MYGHPRTALAAEIYPAENSIGVLDPIANAMTARWSCSSRYSATILGTQTLLGRGFQRIAFTTLLSQGATFAACCLSVGSNRGWLLNSPNAGQMRGPNPTRSVASFAYHQALLKSENNGVDNDPAWDPVLDT